MYRALVFKEWRELWWTGAVALAVLGYVAWCQADPFNDYEHHQHSHIPFRPDDMQLAVSTVSCCLAVVLGLWQTLGESVRGTWRYLRQRPMPFSTLLLTKLAAGLGLLVVSTWVPLGLYLVWAAAEGWHSSPFEWEMAVPTFLGWGASLAVYLAAFLIGIREARWYGSRLWPAAPVVVMYLYFGQFKSSAFAAGGVIVILSLVLLGAIEYAAGDRDD